MTETPRRGRPLRALAMTAATVALVAGALAALAGPAAAEAPAPDQRAQKIEVDFLVQTIDHHELAIRMAQICLQKAVHQDLRDLCQRNIDMQREEQSRMQSWLVDWYGFSPSSSEVQANLPPGGQQQLDKLTSIDDPAQFEIEFMQMLIQHHRKGITTAQRCLRGAAHAELRDLCQDIITSQSQDIRDLQTWLCDWYDRCPRRGHDRDHNGRDRDRGDRDT